MECITSMSGARVRGRTAAIAGLLAGAGLLGGAAGRPEGPKAAFADAEIYLEYNSTDNDMGVQIFLDAEAWWKVEIWDPLGRRSLKFLAAAGGFRQIGLTELRFEGAEPSPQQVLAAFPEGWYEFEGITLDGRELEGRARLRHRVPRPPVFSPSRGEVVDPQNTVIRWAPVRGAERYEVIVSQEDLDVSMTVEILAPATSLEVPPAFLRRGTEYKAEVLAIALSGNRTITEGVFSTAP